MGISLSTLLVGWLLVSIQVIAALPWILAVLSSRHAVRNLLQNPFTGGILLRLGIFLVILAVVPLGVGLVTQSKDGLEVAGKVYGAILQLQLVADFLVGIFAILLWVWPKGAAVAQAAFQEGVRQSMFWLLVMAAVGLLTISPFVPYFTFGEDHIMVKELGFDTIMLVAVVFGTLAASLFITEEIEGRTAVTLMSKPVSRRQFLLGKFAGIVLAAVVLFGMLGTYFQGSLFFKEWWDKLDPEPTPVWLVDSLDYLALSPQITDFLRGVGLWTSVMLDTAPGLVLSFSQVMVLVAIAVSLATRVPMVVNLTTVLVMYFLAHLTPVLVSIGRKAQVDNPGSAVSQLLAFMAQLFDTILPDLGSFRIDPALLSDTPLPPGAFLQYLGSVSLYGVLYTSIVLLFGLILFEDRDLA
jgi:ABC-type transport system involved in multi-copper enzyme maturation permease subunit